MAEKLCTLRKYGGGSLKETVLWTNPSPMAVFNAQAITLSDNISKYKFIKISATYNIIDSRRTAILIDTTDLVNMTGAYSTFKASVSLIHENGAYFFRTFYRSADNKIYADGAQTGTSTNLNNVLMPYQIIGLK